MSRFTIIICILSILGVICSCSEEEYTTSKTDLLTLSVDTIKMDTIFSNIPTSRREFWIYNRTQKNIYLPSVKLDRGNQSGFRVNVDGIYLGPTIGYQTNDVEVRKGDSIRVFIELTAGTNGKVEPQKIEDNISFVLESGVTQKVNLNAFSWDAIIMNDVEIKEDTSFDNKKPIVVYGTLTVDSLATLTLNAGTTLYFRDEAQLDVYGTLLCKGEPENEVVLRGYRLDNMFDYLPYDRISGQWRGVHFNESSYGNIFDFTDLHSAYTGIEIDSSDVDRQKLIMNASTVHNCQGYGIVNHNSWIELNNCQLSNTYRDCFCTNGGKAVLNNCTLAQFYPFDSSRGVALRFTTANGDVQLSCSNSLITGYADDELLGMHTDSLRLFDYVFNDCILRTPKVVSEDSVKFNNVIFELPEDTVTAGKKHFVNMNNYVYDFHLDSISPAIDRANPLTSSPIDRNGVNRDGKPDIGAFERLKENI